MLNERRELCRQLQEDGMGNSDAMQQAMREATETAEELRALLNGHGGRQYPL